MIELKDISKKYPVHGLRDFWALKDVSFGVLKGEAVGIIGRNGAGKTTLLNIIAGVLSSNEGDVAVRGRVLGLFNLGVGFQDELTGRENIFLNGAILGAPRCEIEKKFKDIVDFSELGSFINMPLGSYSQGMRLRLGFSIIANLDFDILVMDEVLAVGDILFQNKCFERLMDFKRSGKTLVVTNQSMDLIERICDKAVLLEHGRLSFHGNVSEAVNRYRELLNKESFYAGPLPNRDMPLVENTKKWADAVSEWGMRFGTKEVIIDSVEMINRFGFRTGRINSGESLKIRVNFTARNNIKEPHFGVAVFRKDGVYCYGPNTAFDGYYIDGIKTGKGLFELSYEKILLAPGEYVFSIAIWDKNEALAFDYHNGCYKLIVAGVNAAAELLKMPFKIKGCLGRVVARSRPDAELLRNRQPEKTESEDISIDSMMLLDKEGREKGTFFTNEQAEIKVRFKNVNINRKGVYLWLGIYRDDEVCCQGISVLLGARKDYSVLFPEFSLLPGSYGISIGVWNASENKFLMYCRHIYPFRMVFNKQDHGTVLLKHKWRWEGT